jgi:hypothetical protein
MSESKAKASKAAKAKVTKAKVIKATKAPKVKETADAIVGFSGTDDLERAANADVSKVDAVQASKPRGPNAKKNRGPRNAKTDVEFAELEGLKREYDAKLKEAKGKIKREYDEYVSKADALKVKYQKLFNENIASVQRVRAAQAPSVPAAKAKPALKPYTLQEVEEFLKQKELGTGEIKLAGRRTKGIAKIAEAYDRNPEPEEMLRILNH